MINSSVPGPGLWQYRFTRSNEIDGLWILQCHDAKTAVTSAPLSLTFEGELAAYEWIIRAFRLEEHSVNAYLRGEVNAEIAGPVVHEIYKLGEPEQESTLWFYGQFLGAHPLPVDANLLSF
jgi:hypothetical protein